MTLGDERMDEVTAALAKVLDMSGPPEPLGYRTRRTRTVVVPASAETGAGGGGDDHAGQRPAATKMRRPVRTKKLTVGHVVPVVLAVLAFVTALAVLRDRSAQSGAGGGAEDPGRQPDKRQQHEGGPIRWSDAAHPPGLLRGWSP